MLSKFKKDSNGFTIIEMIISIAILAIVLSLGYGVLNKSSEATENQKNTFNIQQGINTLKIYANEDFKNCMDVSLKYSIGNSEVIKDNIGNEEELSSIYEAIKNEIYDNTNYRYEYVLNKNEGNTDYIIDVNKKQNTYYYSITRRDSNAQVEIISNQKLCTSNINNSIPLDLKQNNKTFYIALNYLDKKDISNYMFSIYSEVTRTVGVNPDPGLNPSYDIDGYLKYCLEIAKDKLDLALSRPDISNNYPNIKYVRDDIYQVLRDGRVTETKLSNIIVKLDDNKIKDHGKYQQNIQSDKDTSVGDCISKAQSYLNIALDILKHISQDSEKHITHNNIALNQKLDLIKSSNIDYYTDTFLRNELKNFDKSKIDDSKIEPIAIKLKDLIPLIGNIQNETNKNKNLNNINRYIDILVQAQIDTINVYKKIDNISLDHKNKISGLDIAINRLIEIKCDLGDANYYSK